MKKSFSLIETLISVILISTTILSLIKMKDNNLFILSSVKERNSFDGLISIHTSSNKKEDENINFKNYIPLNNDTLRKKIKDERVIFKKTIDDKINYNFNNINLEFTITKEIYRNKNHQIKKFYRLSIND